MHSTLSIEDMVGRQGFMHYLVAFAKPFRMPDFFLISGLFLARVIDRNWRTYLDRKVVHFFYFYFLWVTIHFILKAPEIIPGEGVAAVFTEYLLAFIQPIGTLWFIYLLPLFFVVTKLTRRVPPLLVFCIAAALQVATIETGSIIIDHTAERFVYFFTGYWLASQVFAVAAWAQRKPGLAASGIVLWALLNGYLVFAGYSELALVAFPLGFLGAAAIIVIAALLASKAVAEPVRYCGENSIVIYLAFFLPMHLTKLLLLKTNIISDVGWMALIVTIVGVVIPLVIWWLVKGTRFSFLFVRPRYFTLTPASDKKQVVEQEKLRKADMVS